MLNRTSPPDVFVSMLEDSASVPILSGRWKSWALGLQLPATLRGYLFFVLCLLILAFTMALHVTLSAESMRLDRTLANLQDDYARTERINANLVWEISQSATLATVHKAATAQGYIPITEFKYLVMGPETRAAMEGAGSLPRDGGGWSVEPSSTNPVIVLDAARQGSLDAVVAQPRTPALLDTPDLNPGPRGAVPAGQVQVEVVQVESPGWRRTFSLEGLRAATGETLRWIQDRLPRW